ncbi:hypothetical protein D3C80_995630 [compost metagenome]
MLDLMGERLEGAEGSQVLAGTSVSRGAGADDPIDTEDFIGVPLLASGHKLDLGGPVGQVDGLGAVAEQVHCRGAEQAEVCFADTQRIR